MKLRHVLSGLALALWTAIASAASLVVLPQQLVVDMDGTPRSGARLYVYDAGTTTPRTSFTTNALAVAHANPVEAVATGLFPAVYVNPDGGPYKLVLKDSADVTIWTEDNIPANPVTVFGIIPAETAAGVTVDNTAYVPLDIRRYGAVCDYDAGAETDGQVPNDATDNLAAVDDAVSVADELNGGVIRIQGGGDCYVSNSIDARDVSNLYFYVEPGTTVRSTRYTSLGGLFSIGGTGPVDSLNITNVGVFGGGTLRTHQPDHATVPAHATLTAYDVGDYVLSTDTSGNERAYYCKTAGTSGAASPPDVINGSDTDGTVVWQDADNDNVIGINGDGVRVEGMNIPESSGKPITVQTPNWTDIWILNNRIGTTNDKGIEVKGNTASTGQEAAFGTGVTISGNVIESAGYEGIEVEQSSFSSALNQNCRVVGNLVRDAGVIDDEAYGLRINRCDRVEVRGNKVLGGGSNAGCYHIRLSEEITGDIHAENCGLAGVHLQTNSGWAFDSIYVKNAGTAGVQESSDVRGGYIGRLVVDTADDGYSVSSRTGDAPVIAAYKFSTIADDAFDGALPTIMASQHDAAKIQSFTLQITNDAGTLKHRFCAETLNCSSGAFMDRITAASNVLQATPVATDASTAFAFGGKVSASNTSEFIIDHGANAATSLSGIGLCTIVQNDSDIDLFVNLIRRTHDVNGVNLSRQHLSFRQSSDGATWAIDTTNIAASETVAVQCVLYLP